jgi:hypothetical protein
MGVFTLDQNAVGAGNGHIFPPAIRDLDWIGCHGTSSACSTTIERDGFTAFKPITPQEFDLLQALARQFGLP